MDIKVLDEAVDRLLNLVFETKHALDASDAVFDLELNHVMAMKAAEESMVLLKNEQKILPIKKEEKVAIIGDFAQNPRYQGAGSSGVNPSKLDVVLEQITNDDFDFIGFEKGFNRYGKKHNGLIKKAVKLAKKAEKVILFLGLDETSETEGMDRESFLLPKNQLDLLESLFHANKNIIVVLSCGSAIDLKWDFQVKGLLHTYLSGQAGARATLDLLTAKFIPSGKLAESYPINYEDTPSAPYFPGLENTVEYREGLFVGYRYFDTTNTQVKYPFGFGLSYTSFECKCQCQTRSLYWCETRSVLIT